ncbi:MAG: hypothetical protein DRQ39_07610 [Gammaproteobacteria bacterium]|nr:MAG: hypothetical protein DRQ39_07610 [Gammaproteobacteria bacterium]RKZ96635.1 MAG: hypothetical protein DRQ40_00555 [Gammaproteobacteria bacterium]
MVSGLSIKIASATIVFGSQTVSTPHITSINVRRIRGELVGKARFSYFTNDLQGNNANSSGGAAIFISFGTAVIFSGYAKRVTVTPSFRCADEVIVTVEAEDVLHKLVNKRINRRQKQQGLGPIAFITSIHKRPFVAFDSPQAIYDVTGGQSPMQIYGPDPSSINARFLSGVTNTIGDMHPIAKASDTILNRGGTGSGSSSGLHDHTSLDTSGPRAGGPAKAVYGVK